MYLSWQKIHSTFFFSNLDSFIGELCSPGQPEIPCLSRHLYLHVKSINILQWILPPQKYTISAFGKHPREHHTGSCISTLSIFPIHTHNVSEPVWMYRHRCTACKHPRSLRIPQTLSKPLHTLIAIADIKCIYLLFSLRVHTHIYRYFIHIYTHIYISPWHKHEGMLWTHMYAHVYSKHRHIDT